MTDVLTRHQIEELLIALDKQTAVYLTVYGNTADFWRSFEQQEELIANNVGIHDADWTIEQIGAILSRHGIDPGLRVGNALTLVFNRVAARGEST